MEERAGFSVGEKVCFFKDKVHCDSYLWRES